MSGRLFPMTLKIRCREDVVAARNMIANVWTSYGYNLPELTLTLDDHTSVTDKQRKKSHVWFGIIADTLGNTPAEVKEALMFELDGEVEFEVRGKRHTRRRSFTELTKEEAKVFMDRVAAWAAENGIVLE